jgi:hypothetical protein
MYWRPRWGSWHITGKHKRERQIHSSLWNESLCNSRDSCASWSRYSPVVNNGSSSHHVIMGGEEVLLGLINPQPEFVQTGVKKFSFLLSVRFPTSKCGLRFQFCVTELGKPLEDLCTYRSCYETSKPVADLRDRGFESSSRYKTNVSVLFCSCRNIAIYHPQRPASCLNCSFLELILCGTSRKWRSR